jgi:riboflavin kinase/FMN adenylyltransferase
MKIIYGLTNFKPGNKRPVVALGVFDGLHRGHRRIITGLLREAKRFRTASLIITFFPHPQKQSSLYSLEHRLNLLQEAGVDICLVIAFSPAFRRISAGRFLERVLLKKINPAAVFIGRNFSFGRNAEGNWQMLQEYSRQAGFKLRVVDVLAYQGRPISSSHIRALIKSGNLAQAQELLGRPVSIFGRVTTGFRLGRALGYPTANVNPDHEILPQPGVYAVRVKLAKDILKGICYVGTRPSIKGIMPQKTGVEVHILDFKGNLYGRKIQIEFIKRIRDEKRFSSLKLLSRRIKRDILNCHKIFPS